MNMYIDVAPITSNDCGKYTFQTRFEAVDIDWRFVNAVSNC